MSAGFDPYHKWLGVPPADQPPHHYRLLGIALFESDSDVIEGAADRQMAHVRTFQSGQHSALSQQILNELAAAKVCLLNPQKKAAYDADLRPRIEAPHTAIHQAAPLKPQSLAPQLRGGADMYATVAEAACPSPAGLSDFALDKLDAPSADRIRRHLAACTDCSQKVADVSGDAFTERAVDAQPNLDRTFVDRDAGGLETTIDAPRPLRVFGSKPRSSVKTQPELADHPDYEIIKELGHGGMGVVYLARNRLMDRLEVLKVLKQSLLERPGALERFQQEIRSAAKLSHINIVAAYAVLRMGDSLIFAMEYVHGQDLSQVVGRRGPLRVPNAAYYAHQAALGLQHAHEKGMVHRDIKPNNLMLAIDGKKHVVKILDFGLAKATSEKGDETGLTKSGQLLGTPDYLAPEQSRDAQRADIRADVYSLGCTLYFLLSGKRPFREASLYDVLDAHQRREATPLDQVRSEVPLELAAIVAKMMAKSPADRYPTPLDVAKALVPFFKAGQAASATRPAREQPEAVQVVEPPSVGNDPAEAPASWLAPQAALPLSPPRALPIAVPLSRMAFDTSIDFETPLIDTEPRVAPRSRLWRIYLATFLAAVALMLGIAIVLRTPRGTIEIKLSDPQADVTGAVDGNRIDIAGPLSLEVGEHDLTVKGSGYETVTVQFKVTRGKNAPLTVELAPTAATKPEPPATTNGFTALFNGKDFTGWKPHPAEQGVWRIEQGVLIGSGNANSYLVTERENFTNFHLRIEARIKGRGDSGVYFRAKFGAGLWPSGYEAQINSWDNEQSTGSLFGWGSAGNLVRVTDSAVGPNEWFTLEVIATDNHIVVKVNGKTTANFVDAGRSFPMGHIALEKYRPQTIVEFRKIEIRE
jgi:serine/threonine protein kinase